MSLIIKARPGPLPNAPRARVWDERKGVKAGDTEGFCFVCSGRLLRLLGEKGTHGVCRGCLAVWQGTRCLYPCDEGWPVTGPGMECDMVLS